MSTFKVTINEVTDWEEGNEAAGDMGHLSQSEIMRGLAAEYEEKVETGKWQKKMEKEGKLPFVWEDEAEDEDEAKSFALQDLYENLCEYDYYEPIDCDCEIEEIEEVEE